MLTKPRPFVLLILDGWGYRKETANNAIAQANKPFWDMLWEKYPHTLVSGCGKCVGLPDDQMGNSEVGHLNIGAGRVVHQDLSRIDNDIENRTFFSNPALTEAIQQAKKNQKSIHILGLLSDGGVHSHQRHIAAVLELAGSQHFSNVYIHAFLDGRDTPPRSATSSIQYIEEQCEKWRCGKIVSLIGRYYAMDRDKRWDRVEKTYELLTEGKATIHSDSALSALRLAYEKGETDEFVQACSIHQANSPAITIQDGDTVIFMNFRADRARELTHALVDKNFSGFNRRVKPTIGNFITLTEYENNLDVKIAYLSEQLPNILGSYLSDLGLKQLRIAETEKYAHVTFFLNGGIEEPFPGEERILIPSPKVATYDLKPEMSAYEVTNQLVKEIEKEKYDIIVCNLANPDMVGHTGNFDATVKAIEVIDECLSKIVTATQRKDGELLITADHGNAEMMYDAKTNQAHTAHTHELVPLLYIGRPARVIKTNAVLADIAPTILYCLEIKKPIEMTGSTVFEIE